MSKNTALLEVTALLSLPWQMEEHSALLTLLWHSELCPCSVSWSLFQLSLQAGRE